jgi:formate hydrogenlyase transcriptional activator
MLNPEQTLQLQLEVSETLAHYTTRNSIGLALAEVINRVVPFEFFFHSIWTVGTTSGYRISSFKNPLGKFEIFNDVELERFRDKNFKSFETTGQFLSDPSNAGIYQGEDIINIKEKYPVFAIGYSHGIRSMMIFNLVHDNGIKHTIVISEKRELAFNEAQFRTIKTVFPQIRMAFENLFKYEKLKQDEENRKVQLEVSNVLLEHTNRDDFAISLARIINKSVPCERFVLRAWSGAIKIGYRIPLIRKEDNCFIRFSDQNIIDFISTHPESLHQYAKYTLEHPGIIQGETYKLIRDKIPLANIIALEFESNSLMTLPFKAGDTTGVLSLYNSTPLSFTESQYELLNILLPQIILAFENLLKYEKLKEDEENKKIQLELNNVLIGNTNREDFGVALAGIVNKTVRCERFVLRTWTGNIQLGHRISLMRNDHGVFERISEQPLVEFTERDPDAMISGSMFMAENPGIYQGHEYVELCKRFALFEIGRSAFGTNSLMVLPFKIGNTTCILFLGNKALQSFTEGQFELMKILLPQIMLAFDNLLKYEKLREEEWERLTQLNILTAFNSQKDINEMALDAIFKVNEFIPFEYWFNITSILTRSESQFRLAVKEAGKFYSLIGDEVFKELAIEPIQSEAFEQRAPFLFEKPLLFVGDDFDRVNASEPFLEACCKKLSLKSLATFPLLTGGQIKTVVMMGSRRNYAFNEQDMEAMLRILPYISMTAQQYYAMVHIQTLSQQLQMEKNYLVEEIKSNYNFEEIVGSSPVMKEVFKQIGQVASTDSTVLILGETGTGKELIARAIHNQSDRKEKVLVKVNCASLPSQLIESELFGHEKGSFTGAIDKRIGKFELANGGTIFLDEIGELPLELQAKLLRVLQEREIERIGGKATILLDVRVIAATNRELEDEVAEGRFRSDLFYRLNIFPIHLPPLRERREDIPILITHFLQKYTKKMKKPLRTIDEGTLEYLIQYNWPGNIRELENVLEQSVIVGDLNTVKFRKPISKRTSHSSDKIKSAESEFENSDARIEEVLLTTKGKIVGADGAAAILNMRPAKLEEFERKWILKSLQKCGGRIRGENGAATLMGMKPTTLEARIQKLKITKNEIFTD